MRYAAFLRGINLGSHRQVGMPDLRRIMEAVGLDEVSTYLRSGNALFATEEADPIGLQERIRQAIAADLGMEVGVVVVTEPDLQGVIDACPYVRAAADDPTKVHVTFLHPMPTSPVWPNKDPGSPEDYTVGDGVVYMHLPNGMGRARLPGALEKSTAKVTATTRNWRTVLEVAARLQR